MPKAVLSGQWQWPLMPLAGADEAKGGPGLEASRLSQQVQVQHRLWEAVCKEEIGPLVDEALQDLAQQRTPGTLLYDCMQAAAGRPSEHTTSRVSAEDLRRNNAELKERVFALQVGADAPGPAHARPKQPIALSPPTCSSFPCAGGARQGGGREEYSHQNHRDIGD